MLDIKDVTCQVLNNCQISDARHAGLFSICGLALRLRDLYKWEMNLDPWVEKDSSEILEWIDKKEQKWETLVSDSFQKITISGKTFNPFDSDSINQILQPHGLIYGAGYAYGLKPTFFIAPLLEKLEIKGSSVYILGHELARDLLTLPALTQGSCVLIRKDSARLFLWDQIAYLKKSGRAALNLGLEACGIKDTSLKALKPHLDSIINAQMDTYIYHELGEINNTDFDRDIWREIVAAFPFSPIELLARAVKDFLADTDPHGTLPHIVKNRKTASFSFYVAFYDGLHKTLFPELTEHFQEFSETGDWHLIEETVATGYKKARHYAETMSRIFQEGKQKESVDWTEKEMEKRLLAPLGIERERE